MLVHLLPLLVSFVAIWFGAGIVVKEVESLARKIHVSRFIVSFFLLGFVTSVSEFSVAINSIIAGRPQISVGNLIGGIAFIVLFIIPLVVIFQGSISLKEKLSGSTLTLFAITVLAPLFILLDGVLSVTEGMSLILTYTLYIVARGGHSVDKLSLPHNVRSQLKSLTTIVKILFGIGIVFIASKVVVEQIIAISAAFQISAFFLSLVLVSLGTNIPELSIAVRSIIAKRADIALGDYIGSATVNTLIIGILSIMTGQEIVISNMATMMLVVFIIGILIFYRASMSGRKISKDEAFLLIILYIGFILVEGVREYLV